MNPVDLEERQGHQYRMSHVCCANGTLADTTDAAVAAALARAELVRLGVVDA